MSSHIETKQTLVTASQVLSFGATSVFPTHGTSKWWSPSHCKGTEGLLLPFHPGFTSNLGPGH